MWNGLYRGYSLFIEDPSLLSLGLCLTETIVFDLDTARLDDFGEYATSSLLSDLLVVMGL